MLGIWLGARWRVIFGTHTSPLASRAPLECGRPCARTRYVTIFVPPRFWGPHDGRDCVIIVGIGRIGFPSFWDLKTDRGMRLVLPWKHGDQYASHGSECPCKGRGGGSRFPDVHLCWSQRTVFGQTPPAHTHTHTHTHTRPPGGWDVGPGGPCQDLGGAIPQGFGNVRISSGRGVESRVLSECVCVTHLCDCGAAGKRAPRGLRMVSRVHRGPFRMR